MEVSSILLEVHLYQVRTALATRSQAMELEPGLACYRDMETQAASALSNRISQMLTEARVALPGAQALIGFQFIVTFDRTFERMSEALRIAHFVSLGLVTLSVALLVMPAAVHRIAFNGEESERFLAIAAPIVSLALMPLALGISVDVYVALVHAFDSIAAGVAGAGVAGVILIGLWYGVPLLCAARPWLQDRARQDERSTAGSSS